MNEPVVLILVWLVTEYDKETIARVAKMLDCNTKYEITSFDSFRQRFSSYDWDSPAFQLAILKRYRKICVYGPAGKEEREMLEKLRSIYNRRKIKTPPTPHEAS